MLGHAIFVPFTSYKSLQMMLSFHKIGWWFQTCFPFHIWDVILPIDEVHHFSRWLLHHQAVDGKIHLFLIGKSTISTGPCSIAM